MTILFVVFLLLFFTSVCPSEYKFQCSYESVVVPLPDSLLPLSYSARIRSYGEGDEVSFFLEKKSAKQYWLTRIANNTSDHIGIGQLNVTFNDVNCSGFTNISEVQPLYQIDNESQKILAFDGFSISNLLDVIKHNFKGNIASHLVNFGGVEAVKWVGCKNGSKDENITYQVEVIFASNKSKQPYSPSVKNPVLMAVRILPFKVTAVNQTLLASTAFDILYVEIPTRIEDEVPEGMFCSNMPISLLPSALPLRFEALFVYHFSGEQSFHELHVMYDNTEHVMVFNFNSGNAVVPFLGNVSKFTSKDSHLIIAHDFTYGIQFVLDESQSRCMNVTGIDVEFHDVELNQTSKEVSLKSSTDIFLNLTQSSFYYSGQRFVNEMAYDVYTSSFKSAEDARVVELLFSVQAKEKGVQNAALFSVIIYDKDKTNKSVLTTQMIKSHESSVSHVDELSSYMESCLAPFGKASLYVSVNYVHMSDLANLGLLRIKQALRRSLTKVARISLFRVGDIYFNEGNATLLVLFTLYNKTSASPVKDEVTLEEAIQNINNTLSKEDIPIDIDGSKSPLTIIRSTLKVVPNTWGPVPSPPSSFSGYSGGSMFILAVFMLIVGAVIGGGIVLFLWKRERIGTFSYQVFQ